VPDSGWALVGINSAADQARRDAQLTGATASTGRLFRSPSAEPDAGAVPPRGWRPIYPQVRAVYNGAIPYAENEGALWTGRGANARLRAGLVVRSGRTRVVFAPEVAYSANRAFDMPPANVPGRSPYASPIYTGLLGRGPAADLPLRFGDRPFAILDLGQSSLTVDAGPVAFGASHEAEWWGPGVRSGLVLSTSAPGIPRVFLRTARPLRTRVGDVEARWFAGTLVKSPYFDPITPSNWRSAVGAAASLAPSGVPGLTLGASRMVVRPSPRSGGEAVGRLFDVFRFWEPAPRAADVEQPTPGGTAPPQTRADQVFALTARQVLPQAGVEVYGEWARQYWPRSLREFLLAPHESQAYTLGLQWLSSPATALRAPFGLGGRLAGARVRLGAEATNVEQTAAFADRVTRDFYTGSGTLQGLTHRGRVLGAFTGPGSSSQWLWAGLAAPRWQAGTFAGRVRWNNDALYRAENPNFVKHDVSLLAGAHATARRPRGDVRLEATYQTRYNFLFQNGRANPGGTRTVDVHNVTLGLDITPR
jgi:hypothetical protein